MFFNEQMGEIQLASWGDRLSVLEPWSSLSVTLQRRLLALVNAAVTYLKPQLAMFWYYAKVELVSQPLLRSLQQFRA